MTVPAPAAKSGGIYASLMVAEADRRKLARKLRVVEGSCAHLMAQLREVDPELADLHARSNAETEEGGS